MLPAEFLLLLFDHQGTFLISVSITLIIYYFSLKRVINSILDPLFFASVFSGFAAAVVFFLFLTNQITNMLFWHFVGTQGLFICALLMFSRHIQPKVRQPDLYQITAKSLSRVFPTYLFISIFHILTNYILFFIFGFPIFLTSRLDFFHAAPGLGIFSRMLDISFPVTFILSIIFILNWQKETSFRKFLHILIISLNISICILSGNKSAFLIFIFSLFYIEKLFISPRGSELILSRFKKIGFIAAITLPLVILYISMTTENPLAVLIQRIALNGDIFILGYPNNVIDLIPKPSAPFSMFFQDISGLLRVKPWTDFPPSLGEAIFKFHIDTESVMGPNPRHNIFGYYIFGPYFSLLYSFILGAILGYTRKRIMSSPPKNLFVIIFSIIILITIANIETDIHLILAALDNYFIFFPLLFVLPVLLTDRFKGLSPPSCIPNN